MKEKWYNKKLPIKYVFILLAIMFIGTLFLPLQNIECSRTNGTCSVYSRSVILRSPKLINEFDISDIEQYKIIDHSHGGNRSPRYTAYSIDIYLKTGEIIHIENESRSYERAQEIYKNMVSGDFILKGNYWNSFFNNY